MCDKNNSVAIITRVSQRPEFLERCILSVLALEHANWHHILLVDNDNHDNINRLLEKYTEQYGGRNTLIALVESTTTSAAINIGIRSSDCDYVCILDDEYSYQPDCISQLLAEFEKSSSTPGVVYCRTNIIDEEIIDSKIIKIAERNNPFQDDFLNIFSLFRNTRFTPETCLYRREVFNSIGYFNECEHAIADWEFWLSLFSNVEVLFVDKILASWHYTHFSKKRIAHSTADDLRDLDKKRFIQKKIASGGEDKIAHYAVLYEAASAALKDVQAGQIYSAQSPSFSYFSGFVKSFLSKFFRKGSSRSNQGG